MKFNVAKKVQEAGMILGALGVIGFIGIIWLMIYGNLSGNLGFTAESDTYINQSAGYINLSVYTIPQASDFNFTSWAVTSVYNTTAGNVLIPAANYTVDSTAGTITNATSVTYPDINMSYTTSVQGLNEIRTEAVITNTTTGFRTFFGFSETFFTVAAIVLLIFMLLGLLALVWAIVQMQQGKSKGFSGY